MFIQTEATPNPATIKFLPGQDILKSGSVEFKSVDEAVHAPLAQRLFGLQGVEGVFLGVDFVSITKADDTDWAMLKPMVLGALMEHLSTGQPIIDEEKVVSSGDEDDDEIAVQIKQLLEERVRPAVMADGGDIVFHSFEDGIVYLEMQGACSGCPSATVTLKMGVENMLKHFIPEVVEVKAV